MIHDADGNLLRADVEALVNTVNTVGVMGKGIALQFKRAYPAMFKAYEKASKADEIRLGRMWVWETGAMTGPRLIINFPTKGHWKARSRLTDIVAGLDDLSRVIEEYGVKSVAVPPLGCGNGGLNWADVRPEIERALGGREGLRVELFSPTGAPDAADMPVALDRPTMSEGKAALVTTLQRYAERAVEVTLIEVQKLMYFLQEAGQPLRLKYVKGLYGPYADNLRIVLARIEGHFIRGFGDGSAAVQSNEPIDVLPDAAAEADVVVSALPKLADRIDRVLELTDGFESAYSMELLATVHWVATRDDPSAASNPELAGKLVREWSPRKHGLFEQPHIDLAWSRLVEDGWLSAA